MQQPNILWIQTDQQRTDSLGCYGSAWAKTPSVDALARRGVVMKNAFCQSPICVPSRCSQLTALYPQECNCLWNSVANKDGIFPDSITTFPEVFASAGYRTVSFGKVHTPNHRTWQHAEGPIHFPRYADDCTLSPGLDPADYNVIRDESYGAIWAGVYPATQDNPSKTITDKAIDFLSRRDKDRPFLLRVSHNWPHAPVMPPRPYDNLYSPGELPIVYFDEGSYRCRSAYDRAIADYWNINQFSKSEIRLIWTAYYGAVGYVDHEVGRLLAALRALDLDRTTIVFFSSDHGNMLGEWGALNKDSFDERAWRVPFIWSWPGHLPQGHTVGEPCELIDTARTLAALAGISDRAPAGWRGRNLFAHAPCEAVFGQIGWPNSSADLCKGSDGIGHLAGFR